MRVGYRNAGAHRSLLRIHARSHKAPYFDDLLGGKLRAVFAFWQIAKIFKAIVGSHSVDMVNDHAVRAWADESLSQNAMDKPSRMAPANNHVQSRVSVFVGSLFQNFRHAAMTAPKHQRPHLAVARNLIPAFASDYIAPFRHNLESPTVECHPATPIAKGQA
jgi:hypothetical protein